MVEVIAPEMRLILTPVIPSAVESADEEVARDGYIGAGAQVTHARMASLDLFGACCILRFPPLPAQISFLFCVFE